jgi:DNA polymerase-3 subunit alpha
MEPKLLNKRVLENLIHAGCFDSLHPNRHSLYESISLIMQYNFNKHDKRHLAQLSLLGDDAPQLKDAQEYTCWQMAREEFAALGLFMSVHPLQNMQSMLQQREVKSSRYIINEMPDGHHNGISIAGVIVKKDSRMSQRGMFVTLVLSDLEGALEVTIYNADLLRDAASFLAIQSMVLIMADVHKDKGGIRISALHIIDIEEGQKYRTGMIYLRNNAVLAQLLPLLAEMASKDDEHPENQKADIYLYINTINGFKAKIALGQKILLNDNMVNKLRTLSDCTIEVL